MNLHPHDALVGWPDAGTVFPVKAVRLKVLEGEHPYHRAERAAAAGNWRQEIARNPALFDGQMVLQHRLSLADGVIAGEAYMVPYSTFLWWRRRPAAGAFHLFAFPVLVSGDGALVAVRMAAQTANPGQVYCAAGSLDAGDVFDGHCDVEANMRREVMEETGFDLSRDAVADPQLYAAHRERHVTLYRLFRFDMTADAMVAAIGARAERDAEVEEAVAIRSADPAAHRYAPSMLPLLDWFFAARR